jgi:tetratricopeptide (TPR) repeat protein
VTDEDPNREALAYAEQCIEATPDDGLSWFLKGNCHRRVEEIEEAADAYRHAAELGEASSHAYYFWGSCLVELGRVWEAIEPLGKQLEHTPDHLDALFLLGLCYLALDDREEGDPVLERVRDIDPDYYEEMFAKYAEILAKGSDDPFMSQALSDAARALRHREKPS